MEACPLDELGLSIPIVRGSTPLARTKKTQAGHE